MAHSHASYPRYHTALVEPRAAYDSTLTDLARRVYIALAGDGLGHDPIRVIAADYARRFEVAHATITRTLRTLEERKYISRRWQRGQRYQLVTAPTTPTDGAKE